MSTRLEGTRVVGDSKGDEGGVGGQQGGRGGGVGGQRRGEQQRGIVLILHVLLTVASLGDVMAVFIYGTDTLRVVEEGVRQCVTTGWTD